MNGSLIHNANMDTKTKIHFSIWLTTLLLITTPFAIASSIPSRASVGSAPFNKENVTRIPTELHGGTENRIDPCGLSVIDCPQDAPIKYGAPAYVQDRINYAWEVSHDRNFIYLLEAENHTWNTTTVSYTGDVGLCQINSYWHPDIVKNPNFKDWKWQIRTCYSLYKNGTTFYGKYRIPKVINRFQ